MTFLFLPCVFWNRSAKVSRTQIVCTDTKWLILTYTVSSVDVTDGKYLPAKDNTPTRELNNWRIPRECAIPMSTPSHGWRMSSRLLSTCSRKRRRRVGKEISKPHCGLEGYLGRALDVGLEGSPQNTR
jgi:hypothetical protein